MKILQWHMPSTIRSLYLVASNKGLQGIYWEKQAIPMISSLTEQNILAETVRQLEEYFAGDRKDFQLTFDLTQGTFFQKQVWNELSKIPYGQTRAYKDIAKAIHNDKAVRAVGTANGRNPLPIIIPCHRVIASDGSLGGFAGGLAIKKKLLRLESR